jgi:hypothetical protein
MIDSFSNFGNILSRDHPAVLRQLHNSKMSFAQSCLHQYDSILKLSTATTRFSLVVLLWLLWFVVLCYDCCVVWNYTYGRIQTILFTLPPFFRRGILNKLIRTQLICPVFIFFFFFNYVFSTEAQVLTHTSYSENYGDHYTVFKVCATVL